MSAGTLPNRTLSRAAALNDRPGRALDLGGVYEAEFRYVFRCLRSLGVRDPVLDDALQDVFVVVQKKLSEFDGACELRTWLYAIALRIARKYRARAAKQHEPFEETQPRDVNATEASAEGAAERKQRLALARAALDALDEEKREVFVLARIEQMSAPEIAAVIGIPVNTVYSRLRAARQAFEAEVVRLNSGRSPSP
ncbi:MAG TPA: sigma-70 family RNA polymerase sigma factor [Polyangiaceae bacterium]